MNLKDVMPKDVEIIDIENSSWNCDKCISWNCDKCIFFKPKEVECNAVKRLLFGQALNDDCNDCERPFILKTE
jgi:hypothetical protein